MRVSVGVARFGERFRTRKIVPTSRVLSLVLLAVVTVGRIAFARRFLIEKRVCRLGLQSALLVLEHCTCLLVSRCLVALGALLARQLKELSCQTCVVVARNDDAIKLTRSSLVDPASSHMLVSKIKPCMSQCMPY